MKIDHFLRYYADYPSSWSSWRLPVRGFTSTFEAHDDPNESKNDEELVCWIVGDLTDHFQCDINVEKFGEVTTRFRSGEGDFRGGSHAAPGFQMRAYASREAWDEEQDRWTPAEWDEWHRNRNYYRRWRDPQGRGYRPSNRSSWRSTDDVRDWQYDYGRVDRYQ